MNFRDKINQTIQDASERVIREEQERKQGAPKAFCDRVKDAISFRAEGHTDSAIPFKANMLLSCSWQDAFNIEEGQRRNTFFQTFTKIDNYTIKKEVIEFEKEIKESLKKDGIKVSKWGLYSIEAIGEEAFPYSSSPNYCYYPHQYHLNWADKAKIQLLNIDPYKSFSLKDVEDRSWGIRHTYSLIQGNVKVPNARHIYLVLKISFEA